MNAFPEANPIHISAVRRAAALLLCGAAWGLSRRQQSQFGRGDDRSVVIVEPFGMGDIISLEPLILALIDKGWHVTLGGKPQWRPLCPQSPKVDWQDVELPWTAYSGREKYSIGRSRGRSVRDAIERLRSACAGNIGLDTRGDVRSALFLLKAGCRRVVTLDHYLGTDFPVYGFAGSTVSSSMSMRRWQQNLKFLERVGLPCPADPEPPRLAWMQRSKQPTVDVAVLPATPWRGKVWPATRWQELVARLMKRGLKVKGLCGPGQLSSTKADLGEEVEIKEVTSVDAWADNLCASASVITLDSGPMHMADAFGIPLVALFGSTQLPMWAPSSPTSVVIHHQDRPGFRPCHQVDGNIQVGLRSMEMIEVSEVETAIMSLIS